MFNFETTPNVNPQNIGFVDAIKVGLNKFADFNGRATKAEYWWFFLFSVIVNAVANCIPFVGWLISLAVLVPTLAVSWRRMHDTGKAGGWWFINFIPLVGFIIWIIWAIKDSEPAANRFGAVPGQE